MLLATPQSWEQQHPEIKLDFLPSEALSAIDKLNYAVIKGFINNRDFSRKLYKELNYLEIDGKFDEAINEKNVRSDRILWISLSDIDKNSYRNLYFICHILSSIPYELNKKTQIYAQASELFQLSFFNSDGSFHKKHMDSSFEKEYDNGRKLSVMYFCNLDFDDNSSNSISKIYKDQN